MSSAESEPPDPAAPPPPPDVPVEKKKKKKNKARDAWFGFVGRIVAQIVGAAASVGLGLVVLNKMQGQSSRPPQETASPSPRATAPRAPGTVALAVLPLANFSGDASQDYFADGMTEALIADLAQIEGLRVISRTSSMQYRRQQEKTLPQIASELGVDLIVEGSVARSGDRVRVTAQLIDAARDEHIWARSYDHTMRNVLTLQGEVATAIAREIKGAMAPRRLAARRAIDPVVYDLYLRGRHAWNMRTPEGFAQALRYFDQAIAKDPEFALAYAGLADTYSLMAFPEPRDSAAKAKAAAERAVALDANLAEAHTSLATIAHRQSDVATAEREFTRALELNAGYATAHQWYAILLSEEGRPEEAIRHAAEAVTLDPLSGTMRQTLGLAQYYGRQYAEAVKSERKAIELSPHLTLARTILARSLVELGQPQEAIRACEPAAAAGNAELLASLGVAYFRAGDRAKADEIERTLLARTPVPHAALARLYAGRDDRQATLDAITRAAATGQTSLQPLKRDPLFDRVRADPRFQSAFRARPAE